MTKYLVTGGAGFIGSHIVDALLDRGDAVRVLDNLSTGNLDFLSHAIDRIEFIEGDIRDRETVEQAVENVDYIFHLAAVVSVPESMEQPTKTELINTIGTLNILQAAHIAGVRRLVLSSTCAVYGDEPTLPKIETMPPQPKSPYAISKLSAEQYCQLFTETWGLETTILRYFNVFGPRQNPSSAYSGVISIFVDRLSKGIAPIIFGDGEQTRDFVYVSDVVRANLLATTVSNASGKIFNIGTGSQVTINQLFNVLAEIFGVELRPDYQPVRAGDIQHSYSKPAMAKKILGWSAGVSLEDGLRQLVENCSHS